MTNESEDDENFVLRMDSDNSLPSSIVLEDAPPSINRMNVHLETGKWGFKKLKTCFCVSLQINVIN